jgi:hypothetical protein
MINAINPVNCAIAAIHKVFPDVDGLAVMSDLFDVGTGFTSTFYENNSLLLVKKQRIVMLPKWSIGYSKKRRFKDANVAVVRLSTKNKTLIILNAKKSPLFTAVDLLYAASYVLTLRQEFTSTTDVGLKANEAYMSMLKEYTFYLENGFDEIRSYIKGHQAE